MCMFAEYTSCLVDQLFRSYQASPEQLRTSIDELRERIPAPLAAAMQRPNMDEAVAAYNARFNN